MVTFVCYYCDTTLRKKQCEFHVKGRCKPSLLICIDCQQYKEHVKCISEEDKHWGQFARSKKNNKQPKIQQQKNQIQFKDQIKSIESIEKIQKKNEQHKSPIQGWSGWKNQIKKIIKQSNQPIQYEELKTQVLARYKEKTGEDIDDQIYDNKVRKVKKIKIKSYVTLQ